MLDLEIYEKDLTILSVNFKAKLFLDLNFAYATALNQTGTLKWIIAENTPEGMDGGFSLTDKNFQIIPGVETPDINPPILRGSYHHGRAMNKGKNYIKSRFALVLDPDFFIVKKYWIREVLAYMVKNNLSFFGVPWHPRHWRKYRYFPSVHCLFIDLSKIALNTLDFCPDHLNTPPKTFKPRFWIEYQRLFTQKNWLHRSYWLLRQPWQAIREDVEQRQYIGSSRDTGYFLNQKYGLDKSIKTETIPPVFHPGIDEFTPAVITGLQTNRLVEFFMPDKNSYIPKNPGYYSQKGFRDFGHTDVSSLGWEEFVWQGKPFGFHVRGYMQKDQKPEERNVTLLKALQNLTGLKSSI
jgi:hypothetical protein